jgi:hypothetical protein
MVENNPPAPSDSTCPPVIPLPVALDVSGELIFELYMTAASPAADFRSVGKGSCQRKKTSRRQRDPKRFCGHTKISSRFFVCDPKHLFGNYPDRSQPGLHQLWPSGYRELRMPQSECMPALSIQVHFRRDPSVLQRNVLRQRVVDIVHVVILCLQQKRRRSLMGDRNIRIHSQIFIGTRG